MNTRKVIHIDPKDVMRLSSSMACFIYLDVQSADIDLPPNEAFTEEERHELNTRKPKYVSCIYTAKLDKDDKKLKTFGDYLLSLKVIAGDPNALFLVNGDKILRADNITDLIYPFDICEYQGTTPITIISEWVLFAANSDEFKYTRGHQSL